MVYHTSMSDYECEARRLLGEGTVESLLEAVDRGAISLQQAEDIAFKLHPTVGGNFRRARDLPNFKYDRALFRKILSDWYEQEVDKVTVERLQEVLGHPNIRLRLEVDPGTGEARLEPGKGGEPGFLSRYREDVRGGKVEVISTRVNKLKENGQVIFSERKIRAPKAEDTDGEGQSLDELLSSNKTILVTAEAGGGKSSYAAMTVHGWAEGRILQGYKMVAILTPV